MSDRPHILILMTDQQRADCLSCAGHPVLRTPNMDRLSAEGVRFANAFTSCPICMPARSSFLSGLYCHNHGQWTNRGHLPPGTDTLALRLRQAGWHTCHVGKSHYYPHVRGDHLDRHRGYLQSLGWSDVLETTGPHATRHTDSILTDRWAKLGCLETFRDDYRRRGEAHPKHALWPSPMPPGEHADDFVGRTAVEYVRNYRRDEPLGLFVGFGGPHEPWDPPAEWAAKYAPAAMPPALPVTPPPAWLPPAAAEHHSRLQNDALGVTPQVAGAIRALYYAKISHIDSWFGQILDALAQRGMLDDTAVVFWSDHGEMLGDKGRLYKSVFYEQSVRVPLIVRPPRGAAKGRHCAAGDISDALASTVDIFPTVLDLAGCEPKEDAFGRSLVGPPAGHEAVFSEIDDRTMVFDGRFKMVVDSRGQALKLYDIPADPEESLNLVGRDDTGDIARRLFEQIGQWLLATQVRQDGRDSPH